MNEQFKCNCTLFNANNQLNYSSSRSTTQDISACAYSPYLDLFAWSNVNGIVNLIDLKKSDLLKNANENVPIENTKVSIDCGEAVWSLAFGSTNASKVKHTRSHHKRVNHVTCKRFNLKDLLILAVGLESGKIRIYDAVTRSFLFVLRDHKDIVKDLKFTKDGSFQLASVSKDETIKLWDMFDDGNMYRTLSDHTGMIYSCDWSPTAPLLCSVGVNRQAFVWNMETFKVKHVLKGHMHDVISCEFSPDGALVATASFDTKIMIWNPYTGALLKQLYHLLPPPRAIYASGHNGAYLRGIKFNPTGNHLVSICDDKKIRVWSLTQPSHTSSLICESTHNDGISCTYSSNSEIIFVGTRNGNIDVYKAPIVLESLKDICRKLINQLVERKNVDKLHLPACLEQYLYYDDILSPSLSPRSSINSSSSTSSPSSTNNSNNSNNRYQSSQQILIQIA